MKFPRLILLFLILATLTVSCSDNTCTDNATSLPLVRFYYSGSSSQQYISGLTVRGIGAPGDSILVDSGNINEVTLPLMISTHKTQWEIKGNGFTDTLEVNYDVIPFFESAECGAMYNFKITEVSCTSSGIDSVVIVQKTVNNVSRETLRLYFANRQ